MSSLRRSRANRSWKMTRGGMTRLGIWMSVLMGFALFHDLGLFRQPAAASAQESQTPAGEQPAHAEPVDAHAPAPGATAAHGGEEEHEGGHSDPVAPILLAIVLILLLAKVGGDLFERIHMPAVLGELVVGILLGNFALFSGWHGLDFLKPPPEEELSKVLKKLHDEGPKGLSAHDRVVLQHGHKQLEELDSLVTKVEEHGDESLSQDELLLLEVASRRNPYDTGGILKMLASIGVILLLFEVGLESTVAQMMSVGASSLLVAVLGVIVPMALGWGAGAVLIPDHGWQVHAFIGATLCATSVGITARVLKDLGRSQQRESQIILGAAVIDDVLGLVVLAVVSGVISTGAVDPVSLAKIIGLAFGFLLGAVLLGTFIFTRPLFLAASFLRGHGLLVATALVICFGFSWLANLVGLAPIVGAFAAGLILEHTHYHELGKKEHHTLEEALAPLTAVLVPIFFVQMGIQVDLSSFQDPSVWGLAAAITVAAIIGKQVCAFGVLEKGLNRLAVGLGMIPRGEVGLIFAQVGKDLTVTELHDGVPVTVPVIDAGTFSAVVVMVMFTTMVTPPVLKWAMTRGDRDKEEAAGQTPLANAG